MMLVISKDEHIEVRMQQVRTRIPFISRASFLSIAIFNLIQAYQLNQDHSVVPSGWSLLMERNTFVWITCGVGLGSAVAGIAAELFPPFRNAINVGFENGLRKVFGFEYDLAHNEMFQGNSHWIGALVGALSGQEIPSQAENLHEE